MWDIPGFGPVWFHKNGISNILLFSKIKKQYRVTYVSNGSNTLEVHKGDCVVRSFVKSDRGIFYLDVTEELKNNGEHLMALV